ncbi:hypothetical protein AHiyo8_41310 [Arthrobacter sp. Hiyo8]|nr:hypothetical protein AHiyo8_41310 [Arthrobacter sp. Hiyo8]
MLHAVDGDDSEEATAQDFRAAGIGTYYRVVAREFHRLGLCRRGGSHTIRPSRTQPIPRAPRRD